MTNTRAYVRRKKNEGNDWSEPSVDFKQFFDKSRQLMQDAGGPIELSINHSGFGPKRPPSEAISIIERRLRMDHVGTLFVAACDGDNRDPQFAFKAVEIKLQPINTEGSPAIDRIYTDIVNGQWSADVYSLGIYVNKPGEHGATGNGWKGNAWDIGIRPVGDTPKNRAEYWDIGEHLRQQGKAGHLPVGGIITQAKWCSKANGFNWQPYHSLTDLHWTHVHVSGSPEQVPGWI